MVVSGGLVRGGGHLPLVGVMGGGAPLAGNRSALATITPAAAEGVRGPRGNSSSPSLPEPWFVESPVVAAPKLVALRGSSKRLASSPSASGHSAGWER